MSFAPSTTAFFISVLTGLILGAIWDCFRIVRLKIGDSKKLIFALDVIYFILVGAFTICFFFFFTFGGFRAFAIFGELLGFILFYSMFEKPVFPLINFIISSLFKIIYFIYKILRFNFLKFANISEKVIVSSSKKMLKLKDINQHKHNKNKFFKNLNLKLRKNKNAKNRKKK